MLSYMVPSIEEKPPPVPNKSHLQLDLVGPETQSQAQNDQIPNSQHQNQNQHQHQQQHHHPLTNGHPTKRIIKTQSKSSTISAESSASSLSSVVSEVPATHALTPTPNQDKPKNKVLTNGAAKHPTLKRCQGPTKGDGSRNQDNSLIKKVSFGSSKGSMVETLIYESPLQEEPEPNPSADQSSVDSNQGSDSGKASKVRVMFFECEKPLVVSSPEPSQQLDSLDAPVPASAGYNMTTTHNNPSSQAHDQTPTYNRQASTDSGWDNPFRPDGDLSREADEIVELIKGGKPITPTPGSTGGTPPQANGGPGNTSVGPEENGSAVRAVDSPALKQEQQSVQQQSPQLQEKAKNANGSAAAVSNGDTPGPTQVEPQRGTLVAPGDSSQVEHVTLKKKSKCKCCVIQ